MKPVCLLDKAKQKTRLLLPVDVVIAGEISAAADTVVVGVDEVPEEMMILDIGPRTIEIYREEINQAKTIIWNGPMGYTNTNNLPGSKEITQAMAAICGKRNCGGDTAVIAYDLRLEDKLRIYQQAGCYPGIPEGIKLPG